MAIFLFTARDSDDMEVTERIEAATVSAAKYRLELQGYKEIVFHIDDMAAAVDRSLSSPGFDEEEENPLTPEQELEARREGGVLRTVWFAWKMNSLFWVPLGIWNVISVLQGRPYGWLDLTGFSFSALFLVYFCWIVLPGVAYQKLLEAGVSYRFAEERLWIKILRFLKRVAAAPIPEFELDFRAATALAADGKIEEALRSVAKHEEGSFGKFQYYSRVAGLLETGRDYPRMLEYQRLALEHGIGKPEEKLDLALGYLRRARNPLEAKPILDEIDPSDCGDMVNIFYEYAQGLLALETSDWPAAEMHLRKAIELARPYDSNVLVSGMMDEVRAFLSIALANRGASAEAKATFARSKPLLLRRREHELINRCRSALKLQ